MTSNAIEWNSLEVKTNATGSSRKFFEGPTANLENLECHASTLNPGATNHVILKRPNDEVIIVKEGTIEAYVGDKWVRVGPGSVIFNAANVRPIHAQSRRCPRHLSRHHVSSGGDAEITRRRKAK